MKSWIFLTLLFTLGSFIYGSMQYEGLADNEFAEFEDFEVEDEEIAPLETANNLNANSQEQGLNLQEDEGEDDIIVEEEDSEFEHFNDEEEFEGFSGERSVKSPDQPPREPKITITNVPLPFRANWDSYWLEMLMITGLFVYFVNFFTGKAKNTRLANAWLQTHKSLLDDNFSLVGDDGKLESDSPGLIKESENQFTLWCSGRTCCEGMLVELKFLKRQDLIAVIAGIMRPAMDQVHIKVMMNKEDMESFVFCVGSKKTATQLGKEMADLSVFCGERRPGDKHGLPSTYQVLSEMQEVTSNILDSRVTAFMNKYPNQVEYMHFSDQYSGPKQPEDTQQLKLPETQRVLLFGFNIPVKGLSPNEAMDAIKQQMVLVFYCMEKVKRFRLSKEGKYKADKNRLRVEEAFLRSTWQARAEAAAARREQRKRAEKEKVLADADPERQRRWEEKEQKRQAKRRAPRMKQLKVKAL
ncbi:PAT complex subunit CCDC47 [Chrysoperla carnea]|uniref:PAT complex subunit CCDC47 n=1 Tax=Chrysoperla carnea TaxID=189513 RepID=UPI001D07D695|nr:PAT complex subunit CCDC47 [Chrysoperla carnea]